MPWPALRRCRRSACATATAEEVILAARAVLDGISTPDVVFFDLAVEAGDEGDLEQAEISGASAWQPAT